MSLTTVPVLDPADQGAPSTMEIALIADSTQSKQLTKITQAAGVKKTINIEMNQPAIGASKFGTEYALPPTGFFYVFIDTENGNTLSIVQSDGTVTPCGFGTNGAIVKVGASGGAIGFYGTTPAARGTVTAAAPTDTATLITQIGQIKAALGQTAGNGLITLG